MLTGKVSLITGGSRGIGRAIALELAARGSDIALLYAGNTAAAEATCRDLTEKGVNARCYQCDVSDFAASKAAVAAIIKDMGGVDVLVNNAGITKDGLIFTMKEADFDAVLDINLKGTFNMIKHCYGHFLKKRSGSIINISSISGLMGNAGQANYSASKAGVIGLTKSVARELAGRNVTCNAIAPGFIATDMTEDLDKSPMLESIPLGRLGQPEDVAELAGFLAEAGYITGEVIRVDGGLAI